MNTSSRFLVATLAALLVAVGTVGPVVAAAATATQDMPAPRIAAPAVPAGPQALPAPSPPAPPVAAEPNSDSDAADAGAPDSDDADSDDDYQHRDNSIVAFSSDAVLKAGESADEVVAIFGNATSDGAVARGVVAILGNARTTGPVGEQVVAILGNAYVNNAVDKDVVAVGGTVELGPDAKIGHDVVAIGGTIKRDPAATIGGATQNISLGPIGSLEGLKTWIKRCALLGRPLAFDNRLGWAWGIAAGFLALYLLLAFVARGAVQRCVATLDRRPGHSLLTALIAIPVVPITFVLLVMTVIGIAVVPFLAFALFCASLFGKAVMLAWIGHFIVKPPTSAEYGASEGANRPAADWSTPLAVLAGGVIVTLLYVVPILGFIVYKALGFVGLGVVLYTLFDAWQVSRVARNGSATAAPTAVPAAASMAASAAPAAAAATEAARPAVSPAVSDAPAPAAAAPVAVATAPHAGMPRAGFWLRMGALLLDFLLVMVVTHILLQGLWGAHDHDSGGLPLLWLAAYGAVMWALKGTTIGGSICGIHLVRLDGKPVDWGTSIMRALACFLSLIIAGLGFIWIAIDKDHQAWHDKVAGTVVVRTPKGTPIV